MITDSQSWECGDIRLEPSNKSIQYKDYYSEIVGGKEVTKYNIVTINNDSDPDRIARGSDLNYILKNRGYNRIDCKTVLDEGGELVLAFVEFGEDGYPTGVYNRIESVGVTQERIKEFTGLYENLMDIQWDAIPFYKKTIDGKSEWVENSDIMYKEEIEGTGNYEYKYYNFRMIRDFVNKNTVVNVLSMSNSIYTDVINLNTVRSSIVGDKVENDDSIELITVKVGIQYSDKDGIVSTKNLSFPVSGNFSYKFDEVELEYNDRCIRLFPLSDNVIECIISQCYLYYEKIL